MVSKVLATSIQRCSVKNVKARRLRNVATSVRKPPSATAELVWPIFSRVPISNGGGNKPGGPEFAAEAGFERHARRAEGEQRHGQNPRFFARVSRGQNSLSEKMNHDAMVKNTA